MVGVVSPVLHVQVLTPAAVKVAVVLAQIVGEFTIKFGIETVDVAIAVQVPTVPVTVYVVVMVGDGVILAPVAPVLQV